MLGLNETISVLKNITFSNEIVIKQASDIHKKPDQYLDARFKISFEFHH